MKSAWLEPAESATVSEATTAFLKQRGVLVTEHTHSHVRFEDLRAAGAYAFDRAGYVGLYQHTGEDEVELRLKLQAPFPARLFWATATATVIATVLFFAFNPDAGLWFSAAVFFYVAFVLTLLVYVGTFRTTWAAERSLFDELLAHVQALPASGARVVREEEREVKEFDEKLEAEVLERRLEAERKAAKVARKENPVETAAESKPKRFSLKRETKESPPAAEPSEDPDAKRARLEALRAELEKRKRDG